ncbi:hypothetical protein [Simkania sp.]|uniref:hypothetical protein n=1 Tax=Simkania sp. TaxID=34094 RepID=UPI003B522C21
MSTQINHPLDNLLVTHAPLLSFGALACLSLTSQVDPKEKFLNHKKVDTLALAIIGASTAISLCHFATALDITTTIPTYLFLNLTFF